MLNIFIDNKLIKVRPGISILQACESINLIIPRFCYHGRLAVAGNCRMCLVEVEKMPKLQVSCALQVTPNMSIKTNTLSIKKAREGILEFLLTNHPLDCPICDQGGECDLQEQSLVYGSDRSRFKEFKRAVEDKYCGPLIKTIMSRCIHCTRCVRFANDILGEVSIGTSGRGNSIEISTYINKLFCSELSGNLIDLCPVGALTSKPYAFLSRPWELKNINSIDLFDSIHSNITINVRGYEIMRVLPKINDFINEDWISDKVRFCLDGLNVQRITFPMIKNEKGAFVFINWSSAIKIVTKRLKSSENSVGFCIGSFFDFDSLVLLKNLSSFLNAFNVNNICESLVDIDFQTTFKFNALLKNISKSDSCLLIGVNPKIEGALLNYYIRKRFLAGNFVIASIGSGYQMNFNFPFLHLGISFEKVLSIVKGTNIFCKRLRNSKTPLVIIGKSFINNFKDCNFNFFFNILKHNLFNNNFFWNGLCIFNSCANSFSFYDLGLNLNYSFFNNSSNVLYLFENYTNNMKNTLSSKFIIFQGHHGCLVAQKSNIILPCTSFLEKNSSHANCEGIYQNSNCAISPLGHSKNSSLILYDIIYNFTSEIGLNFELLIKKNISFLLPHTGVSLFNFDNYFYSALFSNNYLSIENSYLYSSTFDNFYQTDIISSSSLIMSKCTKELLNKSAFAFI
jgi:NADH dehydrogenase (ubiquinone) Fe-S protein 1